MIFRTRREMLKLMSVAPFLSPAFKDVFAENAAPIKRLVIMMRFNGAPTESWFPNSWGDFGNSCLASLNDQKIKSRLIVMKGMTNKFVEKGDDSHQWGAPSAWAARNKGEEGISLDQYIVNNMNFRTARRSLLLGAYSRNNQITQTFFKGNGSEADIIDDPYKAINSLFGSFTPPTSSDSGSVEGPNAVLMLARKKSILDALTFDLNRMSNNLVGAEKEKLQAHLSLVRSSELNLNASVGEIKKDLSMCSKLSAPANQFDIADLNLLPQIVRVHIDLITMAMACDLSRVFVLQMLNCYTNVGSGNQVIPWCDGNIERDKETTYKRYSPVDKDDPRIVTSLHQYHHADAGTDERIIYKKINTTYASLFGELMKKLDNVPDGNGTLLDNSISVLGSEYGGNSSAGNDHSAKNVPYLIGGGGGGFLKTNQMMDAKDSSHTQLLGTLLEYFGLDDGSGEKTKGFGNRARGLSYASLAGLKK